MGQSHKKEGQINCFESFAYKAKKLTPSQKIENTR